jgi:hypothetical protein
MRTSFYLEPPNCKPEYVERLKHECAWLRGKIDHVKHTKLPKRPSASAEIRDLEYQYRHRELELAFKGPEWAKYEKYGIWESLMR